MIRATITYENAVVEIEGRIRTIAELMDDLKSDLAGKEVSATLSESVDQFDSFIKSTFDDFDKDGNIKRLIDSVPFIDIFISSIIRDVDDSKLSDKGLGAVKKINQVLGELRSLIKNRSVIFSPNSLGESLAKKSKKLAGSDEAEKKKYSDSDFKNAMDSAFERTRTLEGKVENIESLIQQELLKVQDLYSSTLEELKEKRAEIDDLVGLISGNVVAGSYEKSAATEKGAADFLRVASLFCMFVIVCFVGYSFYETTTRGFNWESSLFRLVFSAFLSIPAAYLARESTKHRMQQYSHLQIALDLKAVNPYISSLPEADQHRLKTEIAGRLFARKENELVGSDSYPINSHELLMALIGKMEFKNKKDE